MVAAHAGEEKVDDLLELMKGQWAHDGVRSGIVRAVRMTLLGHAFDPKLHALSQQLMRQILTYYADGRQQVNLPVALERADDLLTLARSPLERRSLEGDLEVLRHGKCALERLAQLDRDEALLYSRMRRVRNSLTHGNPITADAISSVDGYLMYLTEFALQEAIITPLEHTLSDVLEKYRAERVETGRRLGADYNPLEVLGLLPE
jgi:uncharacterized protein YicC (UPF0701 family)